MLPSCLAVRAFKHGGLSLKRAGLACALPVLATLAACASYHDAAIAPPPPPLTETPPPRPGFVWAPGYWIWESGSHAWVDGHWMRAREGEHWVADQWEHENGRWHFEPGHWALGEVEPGTMLR